MLRHLVVLALLPLPIVAACGGDDDDGDKGTGGSAGTGGSSACAEGGKGTVIVEVNGLPAGVDADIRIEGPDGSDIVTESTTRDDLTGGQFTVRTERVTDDDPIVRTVYDPVSVEPASFCLKAGGSETLTVTYRAIPSSNKLWAANGNGDHALCGFESASLAETGDLDATVNVDGPVGNDVAFDADGNLWSIGPTLADPHVVRFPAASLGTSGTKGADRSINIADIACIPAIRAIALDVTSNLWVSVCGDELVRIDAADLEADGDVTPGVTLSGVTENGNLAFDASGNLWVVSEAKIARYDASRLDADDSDPADFMITPLDPDTTNPLGPSDLAFDVAGNLWVTDYGGNLVFEIAEADLAGTGDAEITASARVAIGVTALIERPAFDESGGLWIGLGANGIGRLSPTQLRVSTQPGDPTNPEVVITSADLGSVGRIGFYPAAAGLPLLSSLP